MLTAHHLCALLTHPRQQRGRAHQIGKQDRHRRCRHRHEIPESDDGATDLVGEQTAKRARQRALTLRTELEHHSRQYYVLDTQEITDADYDLAGRIDQL